MLTILDYHFASATVKSPKVSRPRWMEVDSNIGTSLPVEIDTTTRHPRSSERTFLELLNDGMAIDNGKSIINGHNKIVGFHRHLLQKTMRYLRCWSRSRCPQAVNFVLVGTLWRSTRTGSRLWLLSAEAY